MNHALLREFLLELPYKSDYDNRTIQVDLTKALYYSATNDGQLFQDLFPNSKNNTFDDLIEDDTPLLIDREEKVHTHPKDRVCSKKVFHGEAMFRCKECGLDDSCVLCVHCFNKDDHINHDFAMVISEGESLCDCGDPDAFTALNCKCVSVVKPVTLFDDAVYGTIEACLNYIIEVMDFSVLQLPLFQSASGAGRSREISDLSTMGESDIQTDSWHFMLWNDNCHDEEEVERLIEELLKVGDSELFLAEENYYTTAVEKAETIGEAGRTDLFESKNFSVLMQAHKIATKKGFVASIISKRDVARDEIIKFMLEWLIEILDFPHSEFKEVAKSKLADLLLKEMPPNAQKFLTLDEFKDEDLFENGILKNGRFSKPGFTSVTPGVPLNESIDKLLRPNSNIIIDHTRVQVLLAYHVRFLNYTRKLMTSLIMIPISSDVDLKLTFTNQLMQVYPNLLTAMAIADHEDEYSCLLEVSSQIFTSPTCVVSVLQRNEVGQILGPLTKLIEEESSRHMFGNKKTSEESAKNTRNGGSNFISLEGDTIRNQSIFGAIVRGINDFKLLTEPEFAGSHAAVFYQKESLMMLLLFLRNFQGYWSMTRKTGDHVLLESDDFLVHLEYSLSILSAVRSIAAVETDISVAMDTVSTIIDFLLLTENIPYQVSKDNVGFVNVINSFLSYLIQNNGIDNFHSILIGKDLLALSNTSLRSIVLGSQIQSSFWVRNGIFAKRAAVSYFDSPLRHFTLFKDLHLNQMALCYADPKATFLQFLSQWELSEWYTDGSATVYEDHFPSIVESLISFLYNLLTERASFRCLDQEETAIFLAKNEISYALSDEPKSFTQIQDHVGDGVIEMDNFQDILCTVANYRPPSGVSDTGLYILKPEVYETLDPMSLFLDSNKFHIVSEAIEKITKKDVVPKISKCDLEFVRRNLGRFTRTIEFSKLVNKLMRVAIDTSKDNHLPQLLHLVHAVIVDGDDLGEDLCSHFSEFTKSLLFISKSSMSSKIKAKQLLQQLMQRDTFKKLENIHVVQTKRPSPESEAESKARLIEERRAKVMKRFSKQRDKFLSANQDLKMDEDDLTLRTCVSCGEKESTDELFGILASSNHTNIFWKIPWDDPEYSRLAFQSYDDQATPSNGGTYGRAFPNAYKGEGEIISSCGHGIHWECFEEKKGSVKEKFTVIQCTMCGISHNTFVPSLLGNSLSEEGQEGHFKPLINKAYNEEFLRALGQKVSSHLDKTLKRTNLITLIGNTIRMNEISSRLDGETGLSNFLNIPSSSKLLLRSLIQCYSLNRSTVQIAQSNVFNDTIQEFFQAEEAFAGLVTKGMGRLVKSTLKLILDHSDTTFDFPFTAPTLTTFVSTNPIVYLKIERIILPYLRQCAIFHDLITSTTIGEHEITSSIEAVKLKDLIEDQSYFGCTDVLADFVGAKKLQQVLAKEIEVQQDVTDLAEYMSPKNGHVKSQKVSQKVPIAFIDYPGLVKLIDLPEQYNNSLFEQSEQLMTDAICLHCSEKIQLLDLKAVHAHLKKSPDSTCILFIPTQNVFLIYAKYCDGDIHIPIKAPYLTVHGEFKDPRKEGKATLHEYRYQYINQLWVNNNMPGFVSRRKVRSVRDGWRVENEDDDEDEEVEMAEIDIMMNDSLEEFLDDEDINIEVISEDE